MAALGGVVQRLEHWLLHWRVSSLSTRQRHILGCRFATQPQLGRMQEVVHICFSFYPSPHSPPPFFPPSLSSILSKSLRWGLTKQSKKHEWHPEAVHGPSQIGKQHPVYIGILCLVYPASSQSNSEIKLTTDLRASHALSLRGLSFFTANIDLDLGCLPKGQTPTPPTEAPQDYLSGLVKMSPSVLRAFLKLSHKAEVDS